MVSLQYKLLIVAGFVVLLFVLQLALSTRLRQFEYDADLCAAKVVGKENLIAALRKLAELNFIPLNKKSIFATHPSVQERINSIEEAGVSKDI
jgi:Zn-dependent protease with chaperone function